MTKAGILPGTRIGRTDELFYDLTMIQALARYVCFGLDPGHFGQRILMNCSPETAKNLGSYVNPSKRELLHPEDEAVYLKNRGQCVPHNMLAFAQECVPDLCKGDDRTIFGWMAQGGLMGQPADVRLLVKLSMTEYWFLDLLDPWDRNMFSWTEPMKQEEEDDQED